LFCSANHRCRHEESETRATRRGVFGLIHGKVFGGSPISPYVWTLEGFVYTGSEPPCFPGASLEGIGVQDDASGHFRAQEPENSCFGLRAINRPCAA